MKTSSKGIWVVIGLVLTLTLSLAACGGDDDDDSGNTGTSAGGGGELETKDVAFLPKEIDNPYFSVAEAGGQTAASQLGGEFKQVGASEASAPAQVPFINTLTAQGVDAIAVSANDPEALVSALQRASQAGVKIVTYDSDTNPEARDLFINQASTEDVGKVLVEMISQQIGGQGEIAILSAASTATNQNAWIDVMEEELAKPENSGIELVKTVYGNDDDAKSLQEAQSLLQGFPNLKGIVSPTTVGIAAAARALESTGKAGQVALTGLGTPNDMRKYVKDGTVTEFALWDPEQLGYLTYYAATALADGTVSGEEGETFEAGDLGERTVGPEGEVVLGPPTKFNQDNIDDYDF